MVDSTPPEIGNVDVSFLDENHFDGDVAIHWKDFHDNESAIKMYELAVGTSSTTQDVLSFKQVSGLVTFLDDHDSFEDGRKYYFIIKVGKCSCSILYRMI